MAQTSATPPATALAKRITKSQLPKLRDKKYLEHVEPLLDAFYKGLISLANERDPKALHIIAQMEQLVKGSGVTVNQINQNNASVNQDNSDRRSFATLVRKLDSRDSLAQEVIDAEVVTPDD